jgi:hypothetical protein
VDYNVVWPDASLGQRKPASCAAACAGHNSGVGVHGRWPDSERPSAKIGRTLIIRVADMTARSFEYLDWQS